MFATTRSLVAPAMAASGTRKPQGMTASTSRMALSNVQATSVHRRMNLHFAVLRDFVNRGLLDRPGYQDLGLHAGTIVSK